MRRVPEVIDVWFDSGSMPFAQYHAPHENQEHFERALPGRLHLRGARPDPRLVLLAARRLDAAVRPLLVPQRRLPRPDPRRGGPQDVQVARQRRRAVGGHRPLRRRRPALVLLHLQVPVGRLPLLAGDDRRGGPAVPAPAVEHVRLLRPVRQRQRGRAGGVLAGRSRADRARPLGAARGCRPRSRRCASGSTTSTPPAPAGRSRSSSTSSRTGTCAARAGASGTATRPRSPRCTTA